LSTFPGIPPVKPDKLRNYEVGAKGNLLRDRLSFETALYYMKWDDVQQVGGVIIEGVGFIAPLNGQSASGLGFDFGVTARPLERLKFGVSISWNDLAHDADTILDGFVALREGARLNYSSEYSAAASMDYIIPFGGSGFSGTLSGSATYSSEQSSTSIVVGGPSFIVSGDPLLIGRAAFEVAAPSRWTAMLYADNVNNERGVYVNSYGPPSYEARPRPRTIGVQFSYSFE
jgi:outer membrane receptor protein involved in Fe transport